jgi:hypothetical protein
VHGLLECHVLHRAMVIVANAGGWLVGQASHYLSVPATGDFVSSHRKRTGECHEMGCFSFGRGMVCGCVRLPVEFCVWCTSCECARLDMDFLATSLATKGAL